jgi:GNAT superfamily N-acetyltransferase
VSRTVERFPSARTSEIVSVLCDSFHDYPVMRYVVGPDGDIDERLRRLIDFFVFRRARQGGPLLGVVDNGDLLAAAVMTLPSEPQMTADVAERGDALWVELGDDARKRYEQYAAGASKALVVGRPHHHLNMIGVRQASQGQGLARPLLEAARTLSIDDPTSSGVSLTTETPRNLTLYEHFGYQITGHARIAPDLETWGMFLDVRTSNVELRT